MITLHQEKTVSLQMNFTAMGPVHEECFHRIAGATQGGNEVAEAHLMVRSMQAETTPENWCKIMDDVINILLDERWIESTIIDLGIHSPAANGKRFLAAVRRI